MRKGILTTEFRAMVAVLIAGLYMHELVRPSFLCVVLFALTNAYIWARVLFKMNRGMLKAGEQTTEFCTWVVELVLAGILYFGMHIPAEWVLGIMIVNTISYIVARGVTKKLPRGQQIIRL